MTPKERFLNTLLFKPVDRVPFMEIAVWQQTKERWEREGMPEGIDGGFMKGNEFFGFEGYESVHINAIAPLPPFEERVIEETDDFIIFTDGLGRTRKALKTGTVCGQRMSMDTYIEFAVKDRQTFRQLKKRYEGSGTERYPQNWHEIVEGVRKTDKPVTVLEPLSGTFGYYSMLRNWMGTEGVSYLLYDDPALIEECLEFLTHFIIQLLSRAVADIKFDFYYIHEDISYKNGPLVSPEHFRKFFLPHYKRVIEFMRSSGIELILVDTDGHFEVLIPLFLESGVDGFGPMEIAAGMDPVTMRKKYGRSFSMAGGVDKRAIAKDKRAIEDEVRNRIVPIIDKGGFIPMIDHSIPPDVPYENFLYYLDLKRKVIFG